MLETDVQITADGVAVAFHDDTLDRVTTLSGEIRSYTYAELRTAHVRGPDDIGYIPTIAEVLDAFPDASWAIDVKHADSIEPLAESIRRTNSAGRVCVAHAWEPWLERIRDLTGPDLQRSTGWRELAALVSAARAGSRPPTWVQTGTWVHVGWRPGGIPLMESPILAERLIAMSHDLGLGVRVWTINDPQHMMRLWDEGADGIFTDRPDLASALIQGG